jgi:NAD(P)-dependent dehydrogenase (short-subunit alcohol dehydrogenase family)
LPWNGWFAKAELPVHNGAMNKKVCVVIGVGPGNGASLARRFAAEGYAVALLARTLETSGPLAAALVDARAYACDVTDADSVAGTFEAIEKELGPVHTLVYNAGSGTWGNIEQIDAAALEGAFRVNTLGLFLAARQVIPTMKQQGEGNIIVIGATSSRRGAARAAAFAPAKAAQKSLAESMARHLWPQGVHICLIVLDGVVDLPRTRAMLKDKPDEFFVAPDDLADTAFLLTTQRRSAWSFEVEARPFKENW